MIIRTTVAAAAAALALGLTGCGASTDGSGSSTTASSAGASTAASSSSSAADNSATDPAALSDAALAALKAADSFHVTINGTSDGKALTLDMRYGADSSVGTLTIGGSRLDLVKAGGKSYFKAPDSFWRERAGAKADAVLALVGGKWVLVPEGDRDYAAIVSFTDREEFIATLDDKSTTPKYVSAPGRTIDGTETVGVKDTTDGSVLYVAKTGTPYPVLGESTGSDGGSGTFAFGEWNQPVRATAPPADEVVDVGALK